MHKLPEAGHDSPPRRIHIGLGVKILFPALALSLAGALTLYGWFGHKLVNQGIADLRTRLEVFTSTQATELEGFLWAFDQRTVDRLFRSYTFNNDLLEARLYDARGSLIADVWGAAPDGDDYRTLAAEQKIIRRTGNEIYEIGRLEVVYHDGNIRKSLSSKRVADLFTLIGLMLLLGAGMTLAIHRQIGLPLRRLRESLNRNRTQGLREPLPWTSGDELGEVVFSYNALLAEIDRQTRDLKDVNAALERENAQRRQAEENLMLAATVLESSSEGYVITDREGKILHVNPSFVEITGYAAQDVIGRNPNILSSGRQSETFYRELWCRLDEQGHWAGEIWNRRKNGELYPEWRTITAVSDAAGEVTHYVSVFRDMSEYKQQQEAIEFQAYHDVLTGLPNRHLFDDRLRMAVVQAQRHGHKLALLFLDLDNFKTINDSLGHTVGDGLLKVLSERLRSVLRDEDTLSRLGGDEFTIILPKVADGEDAAQVSHRIFEALGKGFLVQDVELHTSASIGIAIYPDDGREPEDLVKNADLAMYRAKHLGRDNYQFFMAEMDSLARHRFSLEGSLRRAVERDELELHYQPVVALDSGRIVGCEALVRWRQGKTLVSPAEFIPLAEETGLIVSLGTRVLAGACRQAALWNRDTAPGFFVSINISARQFSQPNFVETLEEVLKSSGVPRGIVRLELTESALMANLETFGSRLDILRGMGVKVALDDFGTGYSSLAYLKHLPIQGLKIDRSFMKDIPHCTAGKAIVSTVIHLAGGLGLEVVAEGVETREQLSYLADQGCGLFQGYYASPPLPPPELETLMSVDKAAC